MLCQNSLLFRFFFYPGNKATIVEICLTMEATQGSLVFAVNAVIMHIAYLLNVLGPAQVKLKANEKNRLNHKIGSTIRVAI